MTTYEKYVGDITYIPTSEGWLYLATVIDLYSRRVVGWSMDDNMRTDLVNDALIMAIKSRNPQQGLLWHTDRGSQYASYSHYTTPICQDNIPKKLIPLNTCYPTPQYCEFVRNK